MLLILVSLFHLLFSDPKITSAPPSDQFLISPITGEKIPAEKMAEHMRIGKEIIDLNHYCMSII